MIAYFGKRGEKDGVRGKITGRPPRLKISRAWSKISVERREGVKLINQLGIPFAGQSKRFRRHEP